MGIDPFKQKNCGCPLEQEAAGRSFSADGAKHTTASTSTTTRCREVMGGALGVHGEGLGRGATFILELPFNSADQNIPKTRGDVPAHLV